MTSPTEQNSLAPIQRCESFRIIEDKPECRTLLDKSIQEVIKPAMLVVAADGVRYLIFQDK